MYKKKQYCYYVSFLSKDERPFNKLISMPEKKSKEEIEIILFEKLVNIQKVTRIEEYTEAIFMKNE